MGVESGTDEEELGLEGTQLGEDLTLVGLPHTRGDTTGFGFLSISVD